MTTEIKRAAIKTAKANIRAKQSLERVMCAVKINFPTLDVENLKTVVELAYKQLGI